jgi:8-oxo-dGTP pyrophosphatase MutT (NUDIX family)
MNRQRSAAIIIQDKKILLVRDDLVSFFSMPGGMIDEGEDRESALAREVEEEVGVPLDNAQYYHSFDHVNLTFNTPQTDHAYLVAISQSPFCSHEICELGWFTKEDILSHKIEVPPVFLSDLVPKLIDDSLL